MPIVTLPSFVTTLLMAYFTPVLDWFSDQVYTNLIRRDPQHLLVRLETHLKTKDIEAACVGFHHADGPGAPPAHRVARLVRALLVGYLFNWSLRQLEWQIRYNLMVKWFVGYPVYADGPDHSTLERFAVWVAQQQRRAIFDAVLQQIDAAFPHERERTQVGDTYALQADAAKESLVELIRHTCQRLLLSLQRADPDRHARVVAGFDRTTLFGAADERRAYYLSDAQRAARLQTTVLAALHCARLVRAQLDAVPALSPDTAQPILDWLAHLDKIMADEVIITAPAGGTQQPVALTPSVNERPTHVKGAYRIGSATDTDATYRVHSRDKLSDKSELGYNVSVLVTVDADPGAAGGAFIREVQADTGAQPDAVALPDLLRSQLEHHDLIPAKVIYDTAAGSGKTRHLVAQATHVITQLVSRLPPPGRRSAEFGPESFTLSADGLALTCPHGLTTSIAYRSGAGDGRDFRFLGARCVGCPLWARCRPPSQPVDSHRLRQVFISDYRAEVEAARLYNRSEAFKSDMRQRAVVERVIAAVVRYNGGRCAHRRGCLFADFQAHMNATAYNLKRWMRLLAVHEHAAKKSALA